MAVLITMGQVKYQNLQKKTKNKNRPTILFYAFVHTVNGLEPMGAFTYAVLLFVHTLYINLHAKENDNPVKFRSNIQFVPIKLLVQQVQ